MSDEREKNMQNRKSKLGVLIILIACVTIAVGACSILGGEGKEVFWPLLGGIDEPSDESLSAGQDGDLGTEKSTEQSENLTEPETEADNEPSAELESTEPTTTEPAPTEPVSTAPELTAKQQSLIHEADRLAAGYDYDAAMALLEAHEGFSEIPAMMEALVRYENQKAAAVKWEPITEITHVFYHSLVVDPALAFDGDADEYNYNRVMTTVEEFKKIMQEMYDRGYVLVSMHDIAHIEVQADGTEVMVPGEIRLPEGKIPYVLSVDDPSYYHYMEGDGFATKLVIDEGGKVVCEYIQPDGTVITGAFDVMPLVDQFVEEHPDAAYRGARGILALTGYNGVLGYRTDPAYQNHQGLDASQQAWLAAHPDFDYEAECAEAKRVAEALRAGGWEFASHSYGHRNYGTISYQDLKWDSNTWENTVESIIGETDIMIYAYGADIGGTSRYTAENEKFMYLKSLGFDYFCNVDANRYWVQLGSDYLRQGRRNLDGIRMWQAVSGQKDWLSDLFDANEVLDPARPTPVR